MNHNCQGCQNAEVERRIVAPQECNRDFGPCNTDDNLGTGTIKYVSKESKTSPKCSPYLMFSAIEHAKRRSTQVEALRNDRSVCIPLQYYEDDGKGGAWRVWSCIWLANLLERSLKLVDVKSFLFPLRSHTKWKVLRKIKKHGKHITRRKGNYWWQVDQAIHN